MKRSITAQGKKIKMSFGMSTVNNTRIIAFGRFVPKSWTVEDKLAYFKNLYNTVAYRFSNVGFEELSNVAEPGSLNSWIDNLGAYENDVDITSFRLAYNTVSGAFVIVDNLTTIFEESEDTLWTDADYPSYDGSWELPKMVPFAKKARTPKETVTVETEVETPVDETPTDEEFNTEDAA